MSSAAPPESVRFDPVEDRHGWRLALVLRNHAPGGRCPWYAAGRCHHCDIGAGEGEPGDLAGNLARLEWLREQHAALLPRLAHLVLYDSGSVLNPRELPPELLERLVDFARALPALRLLSLDSREPFVTAPRLEALARRLGPGRAIHPVLGLETADDARRALLDKRMPRSAVLRVFAALGQVARALGPDRVGLDVNVVVGGPGTTSPADAVADARATARFAWEQGQAHGVAVELNVHPYYPSARGLARFPDLPRCAPAVAARALVAMLAERDALGAAGGLFLGWQDEGHDRQPDARAREQATSREAFATFNRTQDPAALAALARGDS